MFFLLIVVCQQHALKRKISSEFDFRYFFGGNIDFKELLAMSSMFWRLNLWQQKSWSGFLASLTKTPLIIKTMKCSTRTAF